jgi:hypothetical protein
VLRLPIGAPECIAERECKTASRRLKWIFPASLVADQGSTPAEHRAWRNGVCAVIQAMTVARRQGELTVERMCQLAGVSRAVITDIGRLPPDVRKRLARGTRSSGWRLP